MESDGPRASEADEPRPKRASKLHAYLKEHPRTVRFLGLLLLSPACALAVLFWRVPVAEPLTVSALLVDRVLLACTALLLPVCVVAMAFARWSWARRGAVAGAMVAVALGGSTSLAALRPPFDPLPTALALVALGGGLTLLLWTQGGLLLSWRGGVSIALVLSLLPLVQFWHATSFVPARLNTTVGAVVRVTGQMSKKGSATGEVEVVVRNNGGVGALVLASELILCYWRGPHEFRQLDLLYDDPHCGTEQLFENLTQLDSRSTWTIRHAFHRSGAERAKIRAVQAIVVLWYARTDRLRIGEPLRIDSESPDGEWPVDNVQIWPETSIPNVDIRACKRLKVKETVKGKKVEVEEDWRLSILRVSEESRFQGVVQRDRRLVFLRDFEAPGDAYFALTTAGEPLCNPDKDTYAGLPRWSDYGLDQRVGLTTLRLNHEEWLDLPRKK